MYKIAKAESKKLGTMLIQWDSCYAPYSMTIHKVTNSPSLVHNLFFHYEDFDANKFFTYDDEVQYNITNKNLEGVGNDTRCIGCEFSLLETNERYYLDFVNETIKTLTEEEAKEKEQLEENIDDMYINDRDEGKVVRIGKINYKCGDDFEIYDDGMTTLVIDWVNRKISEVDMSYFIPCPDDEELDEKTLEERFFKESTMPSYDFRQRVKGGYIFILTVKEDEEDE
jgi:hypothetical protein